MSKDDKIDKEGRKLVRFVENKGWEIYNGNIKGDERKEGMKGCGGEYEMKKERRDL